MKIFRLITAALCMSLFVPVVSATEETIATVQVEVNGLKNSVGRVGCLLFNSPEGFPKDYSRAYRQVISPIKGTQSSCEFKDIITGTYAVIVLHDENMNGKMDKNSFGIPTEGYMASNNVRHTMSAPGFKESSFSVTAGAVTKINIQVGY
jgi:uncharacterized protein (DUF2141 family)